jgi:membrane peptidoglycan carboxypeptidase
MIESFRTLTSSLLNGATRVSDLVLQGSIERSAQRLGHELSLPAHLIQQVLAIEDKRFAWHPGVDPLAVIRAAIFNVGTSPSRLHGASTIVQQIYSGAARRTGRWAPTFGCKLAQSVWAIRATLVSPKPIILRNYLSNVYFGRSFYGLRQASTGYFGRAPQDLGVADSFFLAERIASPNVVSLRRIGMLVARRPIMALLRAEPSVMREMRAHYERHFGCGEEIAKCLERCLRKQVERMSMSSAVVLSER